MKLGRAIRTVALFEAAKGLLVLLAGFGLLSLVHHDAQGFAERLLAHAHLNPASRYPGIFVELTKQLTDSRLVLMAAGAAAYAVVRFIEAYGLWHSRRWAEWFAALSGGIYIPFEVFELYERANWVSAGVLVLNAAVVVVMLGCLFRADDAGRERP